MSKKEIERERQRVSKREMVEGCPWSELGKIEPRTQPEECQTSGIRPISLCVGSTQESAHTTKDNYFIRIFSQEKRLTGSPCE